MTKQRILQFVGLVMVFTLLITAAGSPAAVNAQQSTPNPDGFLVDSDQVAAPVDPSLDFPKGIPVYDSGWVAIDKNTSKTLTHSLGGTVENYIVDLRFYSDTMEYNQVAYGGNDLIDPVPAGYSVDDQVGGYWVNLTTSSIKVTRRQDDIGYMVKFRVRIWYDTNTVYNSGWQVVAQDTDFNATFSLTGSVNDYLVYLVFKDTAAILGHGINQIAYGGYATFNNAKAGAYWRNFTTSGLNVWRRAEDNYADEVLVRIFRNPKPTYDSGWVNTSLGMYIYLNHNIGGHPDEYIIDMTFSDAAVNGGTAEGNGISQRCYGGCDLRDEGTYMSNTKQGAYWSFLTKSQIAVARRTQDMLVDQVRVRIWHFAKLPRPAFDSGWKSASAGAGYTNYHQLGGDVNDYMVYLTFKDPTYWVHQMYYGSNVFGTNFPSGYAANEVAGGYWHELDTDSISIHRADNDDQADQYRVVIFKMPKPDYDSGWVAGATGTGYDHLHNLGGTVSEYLVDLSCKTSGGDINQQYYGSQHLANNTRVGAYYWGLDTVDVTVYRQPDDAQCATHRLRIWRMAQPNFSSGYTTLAAGGYFDANHNLGLPAEKLFVDVTAHNTSGDHKTFYGRADMGTSPQMGGAENDRMGFMWYALNSSMVRVYKLPEDVQTTSANVRIWTIPTTIFLPIALK